MLEASTCFKAIGHTLCPEDAQELFTISTSDGLYTSQPTGFFQTTFTQLRKGLKCEVWVDDVVFWACTPMELIETLDAILGRWRITRHIMAAHKCILLHSIER